MTLKEAIIKREEFKHLIGEAYSMGYNIRDVIVSDLKSVPNLYSRMYDNNLTNDKALLFFSIESDSYDVFVIGHQWSWGSGHLLYETVDTYLRNKNDRT